MRVYNFIMSTLITLYNASKNYDAGGFTEYHIRINSFTYPLTGFESIDMLHCHDGEADG